MYVHASLCISLYWIGEHEYMLVILRMKPFQWVIINVTADLLRKILKVRIAEQGGIRSGRIITKEGPKRIEAFEAPKGKGRLMCVRLYVASILLSGNSIGVAQWSRCRSLAGGVSLIFSRSTVGIWPLSGKSVRCGSTNQANSTCRPFGIDKWVVIYRVAQKKVSHYHWSSLNHM